MTKSQVVQFLKRHPLLLLLLLATFQLAGVLLFLNRQSTPSIANQSGPSIAAPSPSRSPSANLSASLPSPPAKTATKSSHPAATQPASPKPKPSLTAEQQAMNQQYKASFSNATVSVDSLIEMRVAIAEGVPSVTVGSGSGLQLMDQERNGLTVLQAGASYAAQPSASGITLNGTQLPAIVLLEPAGETFNLGDRTYRGRLLLVNDGGKLWAVNLVNLRSYLHSVVASEVSPSWAPEALKAQAVAARSYALTYYFKPMSSLFQLGATEYYQVYSGIDREAPETSRAVDETAGEFVSYRGGIVESLYAASDDIVADAFQGRGMSQLGALNLAEQGYSYLQILANYYPSTGISRFVTDAQ